MAALNMNRLTVFLVLLVTVSAEKEPNFIENDERSLQDLNKFKGYFLTEETASLLETAILLNRSSGPQGGSVTPYSHACCKSVPKMVSYDYMTDLEGKGVIPAIIYGRKQYFPTETCESVPDCSCGGCQCRMQWLPFTAVVYRATSTYITEKVLSVVWAPAFCRCMIVGNTKPSSGRTKMETSQNQEL